jgi:hypothetical protein
MDDVFFCFFLLRIMSAPATILLKEQVGEAVRGFLSSFQGAEVVDLVSRSRQERVRTPTGHAYVMHGEGPDSAVFYEIEELLASLHFPPRGLRGHATITLEELDCCEEGRNLLRALGHVVKPFVTAGYDVFDASLATQRDSERPAIQDKKAGPCVFLRREVDAAHYPSQPLCFGRVLVNLSALSRPMVYSCGMRGETLLSTNARVVFMDAASAGSGYCSNIFHGQAGTGNTFSFDVAMPLPSVAGARENGVKALVSKWFGRDVIRSIVERPNARRVEQRKAVSVAAPVKVVELRVESEVVSPSLAGSKRLPSVGDSTASSPAAPTKVIPVKAPKPSPTSTPAGSPAVKSAAAGAAGPKKTPPRSAVNAIASDAHREEVAALQGELSKRDERIRQLEAAAAAVAAVAAAPAAVAAAPGPKKLMTMAVGGRGNPLYKIAYEVLREDGSAMHGEEIAARINSRGMGTTTEKVVGALAGWYSHEGSEYIERTAPGQYRARPGKLFEWKTVSPAGVPDPGDLQIGQVLFSRVFLGSLRVSKASFAQLAIQVLREAKVPMHYRDIVSVIQSAGHSAREETIRNTLTRYNNSETAGRAHVRPLGDGVFTLWEFEQDECSSSESPQSVSTPPPVPLVRPPPTPPMMVSPIGFRAELFQTQRKRSRSSDDDEDELENGGEEGTGVQSEPAGVRMRRLRFEEAEAAEEDEEEEEEESEEEDELPVRRAGFGHTNPLLSRDETRNHTPTFLGVYYLFKEKVPGHEKGLTLEQTASLLGERGFPVTTGRLSDRLKAYIGRNRKKNLSALVRFNTGTITLSAYGRKLLSDESLEAVFLRKLFLGSNYRFTK